MMVSGLRRWWWRRREVNRFERYLELKGLGVVAWGWERKGEIKDATQDSGHVGLGHSLR